MKPTKQRIRLENAPDKKAPAQRIHRVVRDSSPQIQTDTSTPKGLPDSDHLSPQDIMRLQRTHGNQSVMRLLAQRSTKDAKKSSGSIQRLPDQLEDAMGSVFDLNLSKVNIHNDSHADQVARTANADATTIGNDIYFQNGTYRPGTADGNALIAREVSHIQRAKMTGSPLVSSASSSSADKEDATEVGGIVHSMGKNPAEILKPASGPEGKPSKAQRAILQRDEYSHGRTAGVVTSKVLQGIFTTVLGPIGLVWRYPIIQKNLGEITGWDQFGSRKGKGDDRKRYGESKLGTAMRWMASISEILKEFTIWLGFATFIAAIVAAATHGVAAPVFVGLGIATAVVAGVHAVLRGLLVSMNGYRLWAAMKRGSDKDKAKIPFIKHQMVSDGMEGIGAALSSMFAGMGAGGLGSLGGDLAKDAGVSAASQKLAAVGLGTAANLPTTIGLTTFKEGGKELVKPGGKESGKKGFMEGFTKDKLEIDNAYKNTRSFGFRKKPPKVTTPQTPVLDSNVDPNIAKVLDMTSGIASKSDDNTAQQSVESTSSKQNSGLISSLAPEVIKTTDSVGKTKIELSQTGEKSKDLDKTVPMLVEQTVGGSKEEAKRLSQQVKDGLKTEEPKSQDGSDSSTSGNSNIVSQISEDEKDLGQEGDGGDLKRKVQRKGGIGSRIANWFEMKIGGLKAGVKRLNGKILAGVLKYAGKFDKSDADRKTAVAAMSEEKTFSAKDVQEETENDFLFLDFQDKANQLNTTAQTLAEMDK